MAAHDTNLFTMSQGRSVKNLSEVSWVVLLHSLWVSPKAETLERTTEPVLPASFGRRLQLLIMGFLHGGRHYGVLAKTAGFS